ncbi:hypothetical protein [Actinomadura harenae]|uniref:hypothetical protein n=1 Tax=Actinomadura harenae TaxID=2483351 RepID=UPI00268EC7CA|nr:hypothetical protein [Actinomadura harenae]
MKPKEPLDGGQATFSDDVELLLAVEEEEDESEEEDVEDEPPDESFPEDDLAEAGVLTVEDDPPRLSVR